MKQSKSGTSLCLGSLSYQTSLSMTVLVLDDPGSLGTTWESEGCFSAGLGGLGLKIRGANLFSHVGHDPHVTMALSKLVLGQGSTY